MTDHGPVDPDDLFRDTRMSLGDHLEELRGHLARALLGFAVALVLGFFISRPVLEFLAAPVNAQLEAFYERRAERVAARLAAGDERLAGANGPADVRVTLARKDLRAALGLCGKDDPADEGWVEVRGRIRPVDWALVLERARRLVGRPATLAALTVLEPFTVYFRVSLYCGAVLSSPWVFYQLWAFVAGGLYPHERRWVHLYLPASVGLFLTGVALCEFVVLPAGVEYLLGFHDWLDIEPDLRLSDWLGFALVMPLVFGGCFQTPLVMLFLHRAGVVGVETFRGNRRLALFLLTVLAAVLTATPDFYNMLALTLPLWALYELGILLCRLAPRPPHQEDPFTS